MEVGNIEKFDLDTFEKILILMHKYDVQELRHIHYNISMKYRNDRPATPLMMSEMSPSHEEKMEKDKEHAVQIAMAHQIAMAQHAEKVLQQMEKDKEHAVQIAMAQHAEKVLQQFEQQYPATDEEILLDPFHGLPDFSLSTHPLREDEKKVEAKLDHTKEASA